MDDKIYPPCNICGGTEYLQEHGYFYCTECQTQSQKTKASRKIKQLLTTASQRDQQTLDLREEVHEVNFASTSGISTRIVVQRSGTSDKDEDDEWTSWELHNFILRGMVDELIALGARQEIRLVVLQLWAKYLKHLEVAFISKRTPKLPKLSIGYYDRDANLVYSQAKREKRRSRSRSRSITESTRIDVTGQDLSRNELNRRKRALFRAEYEKSLKETSVNTEEYLNESLKKFEESGERSSSPEPKRGSLSSALSSAAWSVASSSSKTAKRRRNSISNRSTNPNILSRKSLLSILHLALLILEEQIQLSDLLRWIDEGELSYYDVTHFLPHKQKIGGNDVLIFGSSSQIPSYSGISKMTKELAALLDVLYIPAPDMSLLAERYIQELHLPAEMVTIVGKLMFLYPPSSGFNPLSKENSFPDFESYVMGYIIISLKMLLGLDGKTEHKLSTVAREINKLAIDSQRLFVWDDWVKYIECRKSVIAKYHFPSQNAVCEDVADDPSDFIQFWNKVKTRDAVSDRIVFRSDKKNDPDLIDALVKVMKKITGEEGKDDKQEFSPSMFPQTTMIECLLNSEALHTNAVSILEQDITNTTLEYLIDPQRYVEMTRERGMTVHVAKRSAQSAVNFCTKRKFYKVSKHVVRRRRIVDSPEQMVKTHDACRRSKSGRTKEFPGLPKAANLILLKYLTSPVGNKTKKQKKKQNKCSSKSNTSKDGDESGTDNQISASPFHHLVSGVVRNKNGLKVGSHENCDEELALYIPCFDYWTREVSKSLPYECFKKEIFPQLSPSFLWLLQECSRILQTTEQELYNAILDLELQHFFD